MHKLLISIIGSVAMVFAILAYGFSMQYAILLGINLVGIVIVLSARNGNVQWSFLPLYLYTEIYNIICLHRYLMDEPYEVFSLLKALFLTIETIMIIRVISGNRDSISKLLGRALGKHIRRTLIVLSMLDICTLILEQLLSFNSVSTVETICRVIGNTSVYAVIIVALGTVLREEREKTQRMRHSTGR